MKIITPLLLIVTLALVFTTPVSADRIHFKSGEVLEGKIKTNDGAMLPDDWCAAEGQVVVKTAGGGYCKQEADIVKVEKTYKEPEGVALLARDDQWGEEGHGFQTQLIPAGDEYVIGQPMKFHLVIKNVSEDLKWYDHQGISGNALEMTDASGAAVKFKKAGAQTLGYERPLDKGEIAVLFEDRNITDEYLITEPGTYRVRFRAGNYGMSPDSRFPASNTLTITIAPGTPSKKDLLLAALTDIAPANVHISRGWEEEPPFGREAVAGFSVMVGYGDITLWQTEEETPFKPGKQFPSRPDSEYLGRSPAGDHYYASFFPRGNDVWPAFREDVKKRLQLTGGDENFVSPREPHTVVTKVIDHETLELADGRQIKLLGLAFPDDKSRKRALIYLSDMFAGGKGGSRGYAVRLEFEEGDEQRAYVTVLSPYCKYDATGRSGKPLVLMELGDERIETYRFGKDTDRRTGQQRCEGYELFLNADLIKKKLAKPAAGDADLKYQGLFNDLYRETGKR